MDGGCQKWESVLSMMKYLMTHVERAARIVNLTNLLVDNWSVRHALDLYKGTNHMFKFESLSMKKKSRRFDTISWKTYYNLLNKRKGVLFGEKVTEDGSNT